MKLKDNLDCSTDDFFYDLTDGGFLDPDEMCKDPKDAKKIKEALDIIIDFKDSCEEQIEGFIR
jgi:hypothetical protein